ncbi:MAG: HEAT repeat domain-containing protein [Deltaproteobacteria bacterium]|nr:HEAT repeat domain-containing protein [Deltaproteobacteria bacterium]
MKKPYVNPQNKVLTKWFEGSFLGMLGCIVLYTLFGLFLVRMHAETISSEMHLFIANNMLPVIMPEDTYLKGFFHQLGSALFFGLTLGPLAAILASAASISLWVRGCFSKMDIFLFVILICIYLFLTFSKEMPVISVICSILTPAFFFIPWIYIMKYRTSKKRHYPLRQVSPRRKRYTQWIIFTIILLLPLCTFKGTSFLEIRDTIIDMPVLNKLSDFYYNHTLLAAHVIKPIIHQTQKVIAITKDIENIGYFPHGSLWIRAKDPCSIKGGIMVVSKKELACPGIIISRKGPVNLGNNLIKEASKRFDNNRSIRKGVGLFLQGPIVLILIFAILWFALYLASLFEHHKFFAILLIAAYFITFVPHIHYICLAQTFNKNKNKVHEFASSDSVRKRYIALKYYPRAFNRDQLLAFATDPSPKIRLNALIIIGNRRDARFVDILEKALRDPQQNVRTKACWALGRIRNMKALELLERVVREDPSWYVRNYAYRAIARIRPAFKLVDE